MLDMVVNDCECCKTNPHTTSCIECDRIICGHCERKCVDCPNRFCIRCWTGRKAKRVHPRCEKHAKIDNAML